MTEATRSQHRSKLLKMRGASKNGEAAMPSSIQLPRDLARLGIASSTVRVLVKKGKLRARHSGTRLVFTEAEVARYGKGRRPRKVA